MAMLPLQTDTSQLTDKVGYRHNSVC